MQITLENGRTVVPPTQQSRAPYWAAHFSAVESNLFMRIGVVTPDIARDMLAHAHANRNVRSGRVSKYARDMKRGAWVLTHQGIAFSSEWELIDGQHRLYAIIESGCSVTMAVFYGIDATAIKILDQGLARSSRDCLAMAGIGEWSNRAVAVARSYLSFPSRNRAQQYTTDELEIILVHCADQIAFSIASLSNNVPGISRSVRALIARAYTHVDIDRLSEFCDVLKTGIPKHAKEDTAAIAYRNLLLKTSKNAGESLECERYRKGQTALDAFLSRTPTTKLYGSERDYYPAVKIPGLEF